MVGEISTSNVKTSSLINMVGLEGYEKYCPHNTSAGFRFRISLARALRQNPSLIILDDPFTVMEQEIKKEIYQLVKRINQTVKTTFLLATFDISEALTLSDSILLMKKDPVKIVPIQIPDLPLSEKNRTSFRSEEFLKIKNQIEYFISNNELL
jgi:ABC-type nitrate/sulfonate/bicarbonate transport system ATPase subunit